MNRFEKTYRVPFTPAAAYAAWLDNNTIIPPAERLEIEPRVGGQYKLIMPGGFSMIGTFSRMEQDRALTYSWHWDGDDEVTEVAVTFTPYADGTQVHIVHDGFTSDASYDKHANGWDSYMAGFVAHVSAAGS